MVSHSLFICQVQVYHTVPKNTRGKIQFSCFDSAPKFRDAGGKGGADKNKRKCKQKPEKGVKRANLSPKVTWLIAVIPNVEMEDFVKQAAGQEFIACDNPGKQEAFFQETAAFETRMQPIEAGEAGAAGQQHAPVRVAAPENF